MEFVKPESGHQPPPGLDDPGCCFLCESAVGDLLWAEHVICNPYASDPGWGGRRWQSEGKESWRSHAASPLAASCLLRSLGEEEAEAEEEEEEDGDTMLTIQEEELSSGSDGVKLHPDSRLGRGVRTAWRRWLALWLKRKFTLSAFTHQPPTLNPRHSPRKPPGGFWRWLTLRNLLLHAGSGHPHLLASEHLHICQAAGQPVHPRVPSSSLTIRNRCFLDDGEDTAVGRPFFETRLNPPQLPASDTSHIIGESENNGGEDRPPGSWNVFRALRCLTAPGLRLHFGGELDSELEELLVEDEDDGGDDGTDTD